MPYREDCKAVHDVPENDTVISDTQRSCSLIRSRAVSAYASGSILAGGVFSRQSRQFSCNSPLWIIAHSKTASAPPSFTL